MSSASKCSFIFMQIKVVFIRMVSHLDSPWNRGTRELGNGLFLIESGRRSGVANFFILMHDLDHSKGVCVLINSRRDSRVDTNGRFIETSPIVIICQQENYWLVKQRILLLTFWTFYNKHYHICFWTPGETSFNVVNIYPPTDYREQIDFIESFQAKKIISLTDLSNLVKFNR